MVSCVHCNSTTKFSSIHCQCKWEDLYSTQSVDLPNALCALVPCKQKWFEQAPESSFGAVWVVDWVRETVPGGPSTYDDVIYSVDFLRFFVSFMLIVCCRTGMLESSIISFMGVEVVRHEDFALACCWLLRWYSATVRLEPSRNDTENAPACLVDNCGCLLCRWWDLPAVFLLQTVSSDYCGIKRS